MSGYIRGSVIRCARALRALPRETILEYPGDRRVASCPLTWLVKINDSDHWYPCDHEGNIPARSGAEPDLPDPVPSDSVFLPVVIVNLPRPDRRPPIAESLLSETLKRHAVAGIVSTLVREGDVDEVTVACRCGMHCHDHPAHQTEAVITAAIEEKYRAR